VIPASVRPGSASTIMITGTGFVSGSVVRLNKQALATTYMSSNRLTAIVPSTLVAYLICDQASSRATQETQRRPRVATSCHTSDPDLIGKEKTSCC
jgi:hypothetical protein